MTRVTLAALLVCLEACSSPAGSNHPDPASASASASATAERGGPREDALGRARACADAAGRVDPRAPRLDQMRTVVEGCMPVYTEKACTDALATAISDKTPDDQRVIVMSAGCGKAYCPKITDEPRPKFCTAPDSTDPAERATYFTELRSRILLLELGEDGRAIVDAAFKKAKEDQDHAKKP
ncbi:MAG: hypothetical protein U0414_02740 [Polyangiaceae bacterium]